MYNSYTVPEEKSLTPLVGCGMKALMGDVSQGEGFHGGGIYIHGVVVYNEMHLIVTSLPLLTVGAGAAHTHTACITLHRQVYDVMFNEGVF